MKEKKIIRTIVAAGPLSLLVFAFGMVQVLGVEQSFATAGKFLSNLGLHSFSMVGQGSDSVTATDVINGRVVTTRIGTVSGNVDDLLEEYKTRMPGKVALAYRRPKGGEVLSSDGTLMAHVAVETGDYMGNARSLEQTAKDVISERERAILEDPILQSMINDLKAAKVSPQRILAAMEEYRQTQSMSDPLIAGFFNDMLLRIDEIKRPIDVPGQDIQDIQRYPGSVRVFDVSRRAGTIRLVVYENKMGVYSNAGYYKEEFKRNGWASVEGFEKASAGYDTEQVYLFLKKSQICLASIVQSEDGFVKTYLMQVNGFNLKRK